MFVWFMRKNTYTNNNSYAADAFWFFFCFIISFCFLFSSCNLFAQQSLFIVECSIYSSLSVDHYQFRFIYLDSLVFRKNWSIFLQQVIYVCESNIIIVRVWFARIVSSVICSIGKLTLHNWILHNCKLLKNQTL